jgi:hypothetical protein
MKLACSGEDTILVGSALASYYKVTAIDYRRGTLTITPPVNSSSCHLIDKLNSSLSVRHLEPQRVAILLLPSDPCYPFYDGSAAIVRCSRQFAPSSDAVNDIAGPIPCLSNATHFSYLMDPTADNEI